VGPLVGPMVGSGWRYLPGCGSPWRVPKGEAALGGRQCGLTQPIGRFEKHPKSLFALYGASKWGWPVSFSHTFCVVCGTLRAFPASLSVDDEQRVVFFFGSDLGPYPAADSHVANWLYREKHCTARESLM